MLKVDYFALTEHPIFSSNVPAVASTFPSTSTAKAPSKLVVDDTKPVVSVQVRLGNGSRQVFTFVFFAPGIHSLTLQTGGQV